VSGLSTKVIDVMTPHDTFSFLNLRFKDTVKKKISHKNTLIALNHPLTVTEEFSFSIKNKLSYFFHGLFAKSEEK
jgi:hypothetical protein